jgi:hypothetical protein
MTCIRETKGLFECRLMIKYQYVYIGYFKTKIEAILAYNDYIIKNNLNRKLMSY